MNNEMSEENRKKFLEESAAKFLVGTGETSEIVVENLKKLKGFDKQEAIALLNYFAGIENNPKTLYYIVKELEKYKDKSSVGVFIELLTSFKCDKDQFLKVRCTAANALGNLKDESAIVPLMYVMNDRDENYRLRLGAAESLGKLGNGHAVMPLIKILSDDEEKSIYLKESATKALGMLGDERAVDPLINILEMKRDLLDKFTFLREKAVEALGKLNFKKDKRVEALKKVLYDKSPHVRASAIESLSETEHETVVELIEPMINDDNESVAKTAICALYNLEGRDYLLKLLTRENLPTACRVEIEEILEEEDEEFDEEPEE